MAASELIGAAVGVILLIIVAYVVVTSTLVTAETVAGTQKELTLRQETRMRTALSLSDLYNTTDQSSIIMANLSNTGTETISDFKHMDVLVYDQELMVYGICTYDETGGTAGTWNIANRYGEFIHPYSLDPGERYQIRIMTTGNQPKWIQVTTADGVYASAFR